MTYNREWCTDPTKPKPVRQRLRRLQTEQLRDKHALLRNNEGGADIRKECSLQSCGAELEFPQISKTAIRTKVISTTLMWHR